MLVRPGVDVRILFPDLRKRLECVDKLYVAHKDKLTLIPPYGGTQDELDLYCHGKAVDFINPVEESDELTDSIRNCFTWDYNVFFELDRILVKYVPM